MRNSVKKIFAFDDPTVRALAFKVIFGLVLYLATTGLDPLGVGSRSERYSREAFNTLFGSVVDNTKAREIAVVVLNDSTLKALGLGWPISYAMQAEILDAILEFGPKAVFVDLVFVDRHRRDGSIADLREILARKTRAPILVASSPVQSEGDIAILPQLDAATLPKDAGRFELVSIDEVPADSAHSPYTLLREDGPDSAAFAMYRLACAEMPAECVSKPDRRTFGRAMEIAWPIGAASPTLTEEFTGLSCEPVFEGRIRRVSEAFLSGGDPAPLVQTCPPFPTALAQHLLHQRGRKDALETLLKDKYVFYGSSTVGSADAVRVGHIAGDVPGVFVHAAAFENLLKFGSDYFSDRPKHGCIGEAEIERILAFAIYLIMFVAVRLTQLRLAEIASGKGRNKALRSFLSVAVRTIGLTAGLLALTGFVVAFQHQMMRIAPANWAALLAFSFATIALVEPFFERPQAPQD